MIIGLVCEGVTDVPIIQNVLIGHTGDTDLIVDRLPHLLDATHAVKPENLGGWNKVLKYIGTSDFQEAFQQMDAVIVQIDTDVCQEFGVNRTDVNGRELEPAELIEEVKEALIGRIGTEFYQIFDDRIIFAIAVDSIECWLLPLYYTDKRAAKHKNCVDTLNHNLRADGYTIDHKDVRIYENLSAPYRKKKDLTSAVNKQASLSYFVGQLSRLGA